MILKPFRQFFIVATFSASLKGLMEFVTKMVAIMPHTDLETKTIMEGVKVSTSTLSKK